MLLRFLAAAVLVVCLPSQVFAVDVGKPAPSFSLPLLQNGKPGSKVSIADYKGKVVYLDVWASWCGPCRESLPILNEIRAKYSSKGFEVLAVNIDEDAMDAVDFLVKFPVDYPIIADAAGSVPDKYGLKGMPTAYLIDKKGNVVHVHEGFKKKDAAKIEAMISQYLAE